MAVHKNCLIILKESGLLGAWIDT